ncbi:hypothetical protein RFI_16882 [Reticulomyxa filosa]|uniref:Uncharacterized protein n=1 Tax=Reticulomyxa filosa TaxID=46433 RepID=X6N2N6_RETFI|nr:hypothetical protein RFI_16882 [Reticulomyxa filosa]|eukprot:ETO20336.1 hypothetical protein RFI_16882 [Reticulomyxa filosa]
MTKIQKINIESRRKSMECLAAAGRDGFIRIFESEPPFSNLFSFPTRYERVLTLQFLPKTSSFVTIEHTTDGTGNHLVVYENWHKFPNLIRNVQMIEHRNQQEEEVEISFVTRSGVPTNGHLSLTGPAYMRLRSMQISGFSAREVGSEQNLLFEVKIGRGNLELAQSLKDKSVDPLSSTSQLNPNESANQISGIHISSPNYFDLKASSEIGSSQVSGDAGSSNITGSNFTSSSGDNNSQVNASTTDLDTGKSNTNPEWLNARKPRKHKKRVRNEQTERLTFELRAKRVGQTLFGEEVSSGALPPGVYSVKIPVSWLNRPHQRFRREMFSLEIYDDQGYVLEAAQQLWIIDEDTALYAASGFFKDPARGGKLNSCLGLLQLYCEMTEKRKYF